MNALEIKGLTKHFKDSNFQINNLNLTVKKGSILGLVGKNGAGKSTIIKSLFDIIHKENGTVYFYGQELNDQNKSMKNELGVVFDTLSFQKELQVKELEKVMIDLYENFNSNLFHEYLKQFEIPTNKKIKTFSRGMGMKLAIAVALSHSAKMLVLDEATAGLDPVIREEILDCFLDFVSDEENAILMSSHITSDLERVADEIAFIDQGKIILLESKDNLIYNYGLVRMKPQEFECLSSSEYIAYRKRGYQFDVLVPSKHDFIKKYPDAIIDNPKIDEILPLLVREEK